LLFDAATTRSPTCKPNGIYGVWAWRGLVAFGAGLLTMLPFMVLSFYMGPVANTLSGVDISFTIGLAVSGLVFLALSRTIDAVAEQQAIEASEAELRVATEAGSSGQRHAVATSTAAGQPAREADDRVASPTV